MVLLRADTRYLCMLNVVCCVSVGEDDAKTNFFLAAVGLRKEEIMYTDNMYMVKRLHKNKIADKVT